MKGNSNKAHSRAIEQRIEVLKRRVYIHTIPILTDNLIYLIVCPPHRNEPSTVPALGIIVDNGDASTMLETMQMIQDEHYHGRKIRIVAILCTHKHHDHCAGNKEIVEFNDRFGFPTQIFAGAVEHVPMCTNPVQNGDILEIPSIGDHNINRYIQIEVISVPAHTRGSVVYKLSTLNPNKSEYSPVNYLFVGDAMFSGGGGVPFEADLDYGRETNAHIEKRKAHDAVHPHKGSYSTERCFAEMLIRCSNTNDSKPKVVIYPGHEYTSELLLRQFTPTKGSSLEWYKLPPSVFFEIASHYFIAQYKRSLPKGAKLLTIPTCLSRELMINPHFRSLRKQGNLLVSAIRVWYKHLARQKLSNTDYHPRASILENGTPLEKKKKIIQKSASSMNTWNITHDDISKPVFTTVYSHDLEDIINDLRNNYISRKAAADRLSKLSSQLDEIQTTRRPIPNTLPKDKAIWLGTLALAILGSPPCAVTRSDANKMNLPQPRIHSNSIQISRQRLLLVLIRLGVIDSMICEEARLINLLWKESSWDDSTILEESNTDYDTSQHNYDSAIENGHVETVQDLIELGYLRQELFGIPLTPPSKLPSCFRPKGSHPTSRGSDRDGIRERNLKNMKRATGELLRHEIESCKICKYTVGCPILDYDSEDGNNASEQTFQYTPTFDSRVLDAANVASSQISYSNENRTKGGEMEVVIMNGLGKPV